MDVRIGTTLDGRIAGFDTSTARPLLLVGDDGQGKTTTARYLSRWWLANTVRHAHVYAHTPSEWSDLRCHLEDPDDRVAPIGSDCQPGTCLVVVDDMDLLDDEQIALLPLRAARLLMTSHGGNRLDIEGLPIHGGISFLGLVRGDHTGPAESAVLDGQGRLDWPIGTVAVIPDQRGSMDFPCHRWQATAARTMATTR